MAQLFYGNGVCNIEGSYDIRGVEIRYRGSIDTTKTCGDLAEVMVSNSKIVVISLGTGNLSELFTYKGDLKITSVKVADSNAEIIPTIIKRVMDYSELINTNAEDMTTISENLNVGYQEAYARKKLIPSSIISTMSEENPCTSLRADECPEGTHLVWGSDLPGSLNICRPDLFDHEVSTQHSFYYFVDVYVDFEELQPQDWVGAFNYTEEHGEVCVGARKWDISLCGEGICDVPVYGRDFAPNGEFYEWTTGYLDPGDSPYFKIWRASNNTYTDAIVSHGTNQNPNEPIWENQMTAYNEGINAPPFQNLMLYTMDLLIGFTFSPWLWDLPPWYEYHVQSIHLVAGENWISFYVHGFNNSIEEVLKTIDLAPGDSIRDQYNVSLYTEELGWIGSCTHIEPTTMYVLTVQCGHPHMSNVIHYGGFKIHAHDYPLVLEPGWNWVGFPMLNPLGLWTCDQGLENMEKTHGDLIQGQQIPWGHSAQWWEEHQAEAVEIAETTWYCGVGEEITASCQWTGVFTDTDGDGFFDEFWVYTETGLENWVMNNDNLVSPRLLEFNVGQGYKIYSHVGQTIHWTGYQELEPPEKPDYDDKPRILPMLDEPYEPPPPQLPTTDI